MYIVNSKIHKIAASKCQDPNEIYGPTNYEDATCNKPIPSRLRCVVEACRCKRGYVRDGGICIRACDCR